jgi:hypothetical protein
MQSPGSTIARVYSAEDRASARRLGLLLQFERGGVSRRQLEPSQVVVRNARSHAQLRSHGCPSAQAMEHSGAAGGLWPAPPLASFVPAASTRASVPAPWTTLPEVVQGSHPAEDLSGGGANRQDARRLVLHQRPAPLRRQPGGDAATQFLPQPRRTCAFDPAGPRPSLVLPRDRRRPLSVR